MLLRWLPALLVLAAPAFGQDDAEDDLCPLTADQSNCVRVLACVGEDGTWFHGRAFGRGEGRLMGRMSDGRDCTGGWTASNAFGLGQADVTCEDGVTGVVIYTYQDEWTGTAHGKGEMSDGAQVEAWSGANVLGYLDGQSGKAMVLPCATGDIPMS